MDVINTIKDWIENIAYLIFILDIAGILLVAVTYPFLKQLQSYKSFVGMLFTGLGLLTTTGFAIIMWLIIGMCFYKFFCHVFYFYQYLFG